MVVSKAAYHLFKTQMSSMESEKEPDALWGLGTPNGDLEPFKSAQKGTTYVSVDRSDDETHVYIKVAEADADSDWVRLLAENHALIDTADLAVSAGIKGSQLAVNARRQFLVSKVFNIDNGAATTDDDILVLPSDGLSVIAANVVYTEATDSAGAASANVRIGTTAGGVQVVYTTPLQVSKAVGSRTPLVLETGAGVLQVAANGFMIVRHTGIASTDAGAYKVVVEYTVDD